MSKKNKNQATHDIFGDAVNNHSEQDFASLFAESEGAAFRKLRAGDSIKGEILSISKESVFVSTGTPTDGVLPLLEILDADKNPKFKVGDIIDAMVVRVRADEIMLRYKGAKQGVSEVDSLEDAFDMELPVEGKVLEAVKGGFRVQINSQKAFCPVSQMDTKFVQDLSGYVGNKYQFIITQYEARNIVVSRKKLLELERAEHEGQFIEKHKIGDILSGKISRIEKFGAFVELDGGVEALIHISELSWNRTHDPATVVQMGQQVSVKLLKIDEEGSRLKISVSLKQGGGEDDPWLSVIQTYPVGRIVEASVDKKENFGFFVQVGPGINALLPKSNYRDSEEAKNIDAKKKGDKIIVQIQNVNPAERKISVTIPSAMQDESWRTHTAGASMKMGTMADLFKNMKK